MAKSNRPPPRPSVVLSTIAMKSAITKLERRISEMESFDLSVVNGRGDPSIGALKTKVNATLQDIFGPESHQYDQYSVSSFDTLPLIINHRHPPDEVRRGYFDGMNRESKKLRALVEVLTEQVQDAESQDVLPARSAQSSARSIAAGRVFVVHGADAGTKETVARFLSKLKLTPVILHEQANGGRTIIEKFEANSAVEFAVVICTPDDVGHPREDEQAAKPRARQNVILELGFFMGALGRDRVCVLYSEGVELPSDYHGVVYVPLDAGGTWTYLLVKELKAAGVTIDLDSVF